MKYTRTTISIPEHVLELGQKRAKTFRLSFSDYLARLIDADARSKKPTLTIVAETPSTDYGSAKRRDRDGIGGKH